MLSNIRALRSALRQWRSNILDDLDYIWDDCWNRAKMFFGMVVSLPCAVFILVLSCIVDIITLPIGGE